MNLEQLLQHQELRWRSLKPAKVEELVSEFLGDSAETVLESDNWLELICNEVALREQFGEQPTLAEYQSRFPKLSAELSIQWDIDRLLASGDTRVPKSSTVSKTAQITSNKLGQENALLSSHLPRESRFEIRAELGRGTNGVVYEAWDPQLKRKLALKRLRAGTDADFEDIQRMRSEAEAIARIRSPYIVQVFDVGEMDGLPFLAMEFCEGGSLAKRIDGKPLAPRLAAEIAASIAKGVAAAHDSRIIHRDLKPANILLERDSEWHPKVADFGLAKLLDSDSKATATGSVLGTPAYMAPEQAFGDAKYAGPAADIYSIGAILYECLTGRPPFEGTSIAETLDHVRNRAPISIRRLQARVPRDLETIVMVCMQKEPYKRYATANDLASDLTRFLNGETILAHRDSLYRVIARTFRRNPLSSSLGAAAIALLLVVTFGSLLFARWLNVERLNAVQARKESDEQRDSAMRARNRTREALDAMTSSMAESTLAEQKSVTAEQKKFLQEVLSYYNEFIGDPTSDEKSAELSASAEYRVAWIQDRLGNKQMARDSYLAAAGHYESLARRYPEKNVYLYDAASAYDRLALSYSNFGERQKSVDAYERGLKLQQEFLDHNPENTQAWVQFANLQHNLALQFRDQGKFDDCKRKLDETLASFEKIERRFDATDVQENVALAEASLAIEECRRANWVQGRKLFESSRDRLRKLTQAHPETSRYAGSLGWCLNNFGLQHTVYAELEEATECFLESIETLERVSNRYPSVAQFRLDLAGGYSLYSDTLLDLKKIEDARQAAENAIRILQSFVDDNPESNDFLWSLGGAHKALANIYLTEKKTEQAADSYERCLDTWQQVERIRSSSAEFYVSHLNGFRLAAAYGSGLVGKKSEEYWQLAVRLNERQFPAETNTKTQSEGLSSLFCIRISGLLPRAAFDEAIEVIESVCNKPEFSDDVASYNLACAFSIVAIALSEDDPRRLQCCDRAMQLLQDAASKGWRDTGLSEQDPDLNALRSRPDFQEWLTRLRGEK